MRQWIRDGTNPRATPIGPEPRSWAAGVIEVTGKIRLRITNGVPYSAVVEASTGSKEVARELVTLVGGACRGTRWWVPAHEQYDVLTRLLPLLVTPTQRNSAMKVMRFRRTQGAVMRGRPVPPSVVAYRRRLASRVETNRGDA